MEGEREREGECPQLLVHFPNAVNGCGYRTRVRSYECNQGLHVGGKNCCLSHNCFCSWSVLTGSYEPKLGNELWYPDLDCVNFIKYFHEANSSLRWKKQDTILLFFFIIHLYSRDLYFYSELFYSWFLFFLLSHICTWRRMKNMNKVDWGEGAEWSHAVCKDRWTTNKDLSFPSVPIQIKSDSS